MKIKKVEKFCKDCGKPAKYCDPYYQCETCWEEWWSSLDEADDNGHHTSQQIRKMRERDD